MPFIPFTEYLGMREKDGRNFEVYRKADPEGFVVGTFDTQDNSFYTGTGQKGGI